ncbi:MAG TPA: sialate O-acetylesterase [Terriglobia bacterium]|nr:sialate O-acetylesterase [Terriglobia bacterium]
MRQRRYKGLFLLLGCLLLASTAGMASVKLPSLISDNMVLQEGAKDRIWGTADPSERVTVTIAGKEASAVANTQGRWAVEIGPLKAGGPFELTVRGSNVIVVHDVMVGEVWVCSGQSNMEFSVGPANSGWETAVQNYKQEIADAHYPLIRMFTVKKTVAGKPQQDVEGQWEVTSPVTVGHFTAVGYFFGLNLFKTMHVPIGLIHSSWGGTPAESWTSLPTLQSDPEFKSILQKYQEQKNKFLSNLTDFNSRFESWREDSAKKTAEGVPIPPPPVVRNDPRGNPWRPAGLYNAMIMPIVPYRIKGVIWYQGESNSDRGYQYRKLFPDMIRDWRHAWNEGNFPFLFVQLANFQILPNSLSFPLVREAQLMTLSLPKTGMAVTIDIGSATTIHPRNKQEVGRRLSLAARAIAYGQHIIYSGPIYKSMEVEGNKVRLHFTHLGGGLATSNRTVLGFEIAGADRKFVTASAEIQGDTVVVSSGAVAHPVAVRYGWANNPICNLYNEAGLPASPFRTDDWRDPSEAAE